jgi:hypothetical protein
MRADGQLWGECISSALSEDAFLRVQEREVAQRNSASSSSRLNACCTFGGSSRTQLPQVLQRGVDLPSQPRLGEFPEVFP